MDYHSKDFKDNQDATDTEYLLKDKPNNSKAKASINQLEPLHNQIQLDYEQHNLNDLLNLKDNKEIEITPVLKEDYTLLTLNNISHCQSCKEKFDSKRNAPYLLPCNHFFCKKCIEGFSIGAYLINCPIDGKVANSFSELSLLSNLLSKEDSNDSNEQHYCPKHPEQKLTHFIEETREVICIYCAFNLMKTHSQYHIVELEEKSTQLIANLDTVLENNHQYAEGLQGALEIIKKNKETVDEQIGVIYDKMIHYLNERKEDLLKRTEAVFSENAIALSEKLDFFSGNIELAEKVKEELLMTKGSVEFSKAVDKYDSVISETNNNSKLSLAYKEMALAVEEEKKIMRTLGGFTQLNSQGKVVNFGGENKMGMNMTMTKTLNTMQNEPALIDKRKQYQEEMYNETSNNNNNSSSKSKLQQYLAPDSICRTSGSYSSNTKQYEPYLNPQAKRQKQYIVNSNTNTNSNPNSNTIENNTNANFTKNKNTSSYGSRSKIGFSQSQIVGGPLSYDYRKKRDLSFDKHE